MPMRRNGCVFMRDVMETLTEQIKEMMGARLQRTQRLDGMKAVYFVAHRAISRSGRSRRVFSTR